MISAAPLLPPAAIDALLAVLLVVVIVLVAGWFLVAYAVRVDRLHRQVLAARLIVSGQLSKRAHAAIELANAQVLDQADSEKLCQAAHSASRCEEPIVGDGLDPRNRTGNAAKRVAYENQLTRVMREVLTDETRNSLMQEADATALLRRLDAAQQKLEVAVHVHNNQVKDARKVRQRALVRIAHLAGRAPLPAPVEI